ncbi:hypothetical protein PFISCL1PPCAC_19473 [Pristionchus fissidentatus]|uniref:ADP ribosylation factor n=1 Tax=Pristionchus fissidentatus TaxID=1538716 RepID=A0AAV5WBJ1_9BILA|nr:hypothetical protein PFISCL1PPCAC_19473 [Pristionchus fissidentatus]
MRRQPDHKAKVVFMGSSGVGKTSIILRHNGREFSTEVTPTLGANFVHSTIMTQTSKRVELEIWDTAGSEKFACMMPMYLRRSRGAFLVFDVADRQTFTDILKWYGELERACNVAELSLVLVGNKIDLEHRRIVDEMEGRTFAEERNMMYIETSALQDRRIGEMMHTMANQLISRYESRHLSSQSKVEDTVVMTPPTTERENKCNCTNNV